MDSKESWAASADGRKVSSKRRRALISCTECHRRKQKVGPFVDGEILHHSCQTSIPSWQSKTNADPQIQCDRCRPCQNCIKRCRLVGPYHYFHNVFYCSDCGCRTCASTKRMTKTVALQAPHMKIQPVLAQYHSQTLRHCLR